MQLNTKHFGIIEISEKDTIDFSEGLPGFESVRKFILLDSENADSPFGWLQSVDSPDLAFAVVNPFQIKKDYDINIEDDVVKLLGIESEEDVLVYSIVVVPDDISKMSMNLKAPVIINRRSNKGMQVVLNTDKYGVRHYILDELRGQEVAENACTDKKKGSVHNNK